MKQIKTSEFDDTISKGYVLVDFYADWCGPCKMLSPILDELSGDYQGKVAFVKVNVDDEEALAQRFQIMSIPTVKLFKDGQEVKSFMGFMPKPAVKDLIDKTIG